MDTKYTAKTSINIKAPVSVVWEALTNPKVIKEWFYGTQAISDWKVGSSLNFKGVWEGKEYVDKGKILEVIPMKLLKFNYLSSLSGMDDVPSNYANITYELIENEEGTELFVTQENIQSEEVKSHSEKGWNTVMKSLKELLEVVNK